MQAAELYNGWFYWYFVAYMQKVQRWVAPEGVN